MLGSFPSDGEAWRNAGQPSSHAKPLHAVTSLTELATRWGGAQNAAEIIGVVENARLMFDIDGLGQEGDLAKIKIVSKYGPGKSYIEDHASYRVNGKASDAFKATWGPDGTGAIRLWMFQADGNAFGGQVFSDGTSLVVKLKGARSMDARAVGFHGVHRWEADLVFTPMGSGTAVFQTKNILIDGSTRLPDMEPCTVRAITIATDRLGPSTT